jgi:hypothetical protein
MRRKETSNTLVRNELRLAAQLWPGQIEKHQKKSLEFLWKSFRFSVAKGDLQLLDHKWYVTHSGLLRLAHRRHCSGIRVQAVRSFCEPTTGRWVFRATLLTSPTCRGFVGYGDADPSNVSPVVRGAEMRVAETRAVNRALRKAYGIGMCSVEEIGSLPARSQPEPNVRKLPPQPANGNGETRIFLMLSPASEARLSGNFAMLLRGQCCGACSECCRVGRRFPHFRFVLPPFGRRDSPASIVGSSRIDRSRRNSICLFSERCSRSASSASLALRLAGIRNSRRTRASFIGLGALLEE